MKKPAEFSKKVYVYWSIEDDLVPIATEDIRGLEDGTTIGVYELKETKTLKVREELV